MNTPNYLYHYTSIENLSLILKNKSLRFSRADQVNDLEEVNCSDSTNLKKNVFISCWSYEDSESIPMWNLYSNNAKGVRIKLKCPIFSDSEFTNAVDMSNTQLTIFKNFKVFVKRQNVNEWIKYAFGPVEVKYQDDTSVKVLDSANNLAIENIGTIKKKHWSFENEYRFIILANHDWFNDIGKFKFRTKGSFLYSDIEAVYVDIGIDQTIFNEIEVLLGPSCGEPEKIIVESLLKSYTTNGKYFESNLNKIVNLR